ncbi:MAG: hypothetical protein WCH99_14570 [Verrucomicrobiota bacterium]
MKNVSSPDAARFSSVPPSATAVYVAQQIVPEFIRVPKPGQLCPFTGLSRSKMIELITASEANDWKPPVQSVSLCQKGRRRGCRLVVFSSLISYLNSNLNEAN